MTILGISVDDAAASRRLAAAERIPFALLADETRAVSQAYVGVDDHDLAVPGVVLVRGDGSVALRRVSRDKADRPTTGELLAEVDRALGVSEGGVGARGGYGPLERLQLGLAVGGGVREDGGGAAVATVSLLYPVARLVVAGVSVGGEAVGRRVDVDAVAGVRLPFYGDLADVSFMAVGGWSAGDRGAGWHAGGRLALDFAWTPSWGTAIVVGVTALELDSGAVAEGTVSLQITRLVRWR